MSHRENSLRSMNFTEMIQVDDGTKMKDQELQSLNFDLGFLITS